jgi:hypothetical protein
VRELHRPEGRPRLYLGSNRRTTANDTRQQTPGAYIFIFSVRLALIVPSPPALIMPCGSAEAMNPHLMKISTAVAPGLMPY